MQQKTLKKFDFWSYAVLKLLTVAINLKGGILLTTWAWFLGLPHLFQNKLTYYSLEAFHRIAQRQLKSLRTDFFKGRGHGTGT